MPVIRCIDCTVYFAVQLYASSDFPRKMRVTRCDWDAHVCCSSGNHDPVYMWRAPMFTPCQSAFLDTATRIPKFLDGPHNTYNRSTNSSRLQHRNRSKSRDGHSHTHDTCEGIKTSYTHTSAYGPMGIESGYGNIYCWRLIWLKGALPPDNGPPLFPLETPF